MPFPLAPTNGQITVVNNINYQYNSTGTGYWTRLYLTATNTLIMATSGTFSVLYVNSSTNSTSTTTGALIVTGGIGVGGNVYIGGNLNSSGTTYLNDRVIIASTATSTATNNGALYVAGSVNAGSLYANGLQILPTTIQEFTASQGQSIFTVTNGYAVGQLQVFANGVNLGSADVTATNGSTFTVSQARNSGDVIRIISGQLLSTGNTAGVVNGTLNVVGSLQENGTDVSALITAFSTVMG
jgi:hypothetical protein